MVLGIGAISWSLFQIWEQSNYINSMVYIEKEQIDTKERNPSPVGSTTTDSLYPVYPQKGENIGSLSIPTLEQTLPIIQGTDEDELKKGVGHFIESVLPGEVDNCVLSGHRDTVFSKLGKLKIGDLLIVQTSAGIFTYEITTIRIVDKDDKTIIVPTENAVLTVSTCYPFSFIGSAPDRYILIANLVTRNET